MKNNEITSGAGFVTGIAVGGILGAVVTYMLVTPSGRRITQWLLDTAEEISHHGEEMVGISKPTSSINDVQKRLVKKSVDRS